MLMTKKDFIALADELRSSRIQSKHLNDTVVDDLCRFMRNSNPQFNETRWRNYLDGKCGPNGGK